MLFCRKKAGKTGAMKRERGASEALYPQPENKYTRERKRGNKGKTTKNSLFLSSHSFFLSSPSHFSSPRISEQQNEEGCLSSPYPLSPSIWKKEEREILCPSNIRPLHTYWGGWREKKLFQSLFFSRGQGKGCMSVRVREKARKTLKTNKFFASRKKQTKKHKEE